jgi:large subunit ribosomal protein L25
MADVLTVKIRESFGKLESRRMRRRGEIPAELYGHGEPNAHLVLPMTEITTAIRHGAHLVELKGAVNESALIKEVQWDPYGTAVLHLDLARVSAEETVEVMLHVELKGTAPGTKEGGIVQLVLYDVKILCPAGLIPDKLEAKIGNLQVGGQLTAGELELPKGATLVTPADQLVAQCVLPVVHEEVAAAVQAEGNEPELIRKPKEVAEGEAEE